MRILVPRKRFNKPGLVLARRVDEPLVVSRKDCRARPARACETAVLVVRPGVAAHTTVLTKLEGGGTRTSVMGVELAASGLVGCELPVGGHAADILSAVKDEKVAMVTTNALPGVGLGQRLSGRAGYSSGQKGRQQRKSPHDGNDASVSVKHGTRNWIVQGGTAC